MFANGRTNAEREAHDWFRRSLEANRNHTLSHFQFAGAAGLDGIVSWGALNRKVERRQAQAEERHSKLRLPRHLLHGLINK